MTAQTANRSTRKTMGRAFVKSIPILCSYLFVGMAYFLLPALILAAGQDTLTDPDNACKMTKETIVWRRLREKICY